MSSFQALCETIATQCHSAYVRHMLLTNEAVYASYIADPAVKEQVLAAFPEHGPLDRLRYEALSAWNCLKKFHGFYSLDELHSKFGNDIQRRIETLRKATTITTRLEDGDLLRVAQLQVRLERSIATLDHAMVAYEASPQGQTCRTFFEARLSAAGHAPAPHPTPRLDFVVAPHHTGHHHAPRHWAHTVQPAVAGAACGAGF